MSATVEQIMDALTARAENHPQASGTRYRTCYNHRDGQNVPCETARATAWLYKLTDHPKRECDTCHGYGWRYAPDLPDGKPSLEHLPCPNCGGSGLEHEPHHLPPEKEEA